MEDNVTYESRFSYEDFVWGAAHLCHIAEQDKSYLRELEKVHSKKRKRCMNLWCLSEVDENFYSIKNKSSSGYKKYLGLLEDNMMSHYMARTPRVHLGNTFYMNGNQWPGAGVKKTWHVFSLVFRYHHLQNHEGHAYWIYAAYIYSVGCCYPDFILQLKKLVCSIPRDGNVKYLIPNDEYLTCVSKKYKQCREFVGTRFVYSTEIYVKSLIKFAVKLSARRSYKEEIVKLIADDSTLMGFDYKKLYLFLKRYRLVGRNSCGHGVNNGNYSATSD